MLVFLFSLFVITGSLVNADDSDQDNVKPYAEDWYVTPEDIIKDIIFPAIDKRVMEEYPDNEDVIFGWRSQRIDGIVYNNNHSYDISIKIEVPSPQNMATEYKEDLVTVRLSPSCDSPKMSCKHGFNVEVVAYKRLSE